MFRNSKRKPTKRNTKYNLRDEYGRFVKASKLYEQCEKAFEPKHQCKCGCDPDGCCGEDLIIQGVDKLLDELGVDDSVDHTVEVDIVVDGKRILSSR